MHKLKRALLPLLLLLVLLTGCETAGPARQTVIDLSALPEYSGQPYVELNGNVPFFTQEELTTKGHNFELEESGSTVLCVDYRQNGIGSASCGPDLMEKYRLTDETIDFSIRLIPESK